MTAQRQETLPTGRLALTLLALGLVALPSGAAARSATQVETTLTLAPGALRARSGALPAIDGFRDGRTPGQPALPERLLRVALHPHANLGSLQLSLENGPVDSLQGRYDLAPNPPYRFGVRGATLLDWGRDATRRRIVAGRDSGAYGAAIFPAREVTRVRVSNRRGLLVLELRYRPLRYRHARGEALLTRHTRLRVRYSLRSGLPAQRPDALLEPYLGRVDNRDEARRFYGRADQTQPPGYAIVIPTKLRQASKKLDAFIEHKRARGFNVVVVDDEKLAEIPGSDTLAAAERIRGWLKARYQALGLAYALLIGNPTPSKPGAPMKIVHTAEMHPSIKELTPTDHYYADLTGDWDKDGDGKFAIYPKDGGEGGIDFTPEIIVGRIPVYDDNVAVLDTILARTIAYENEPGDRAWRSRVLQPAAMLFLENQYGQATTHRQDGADQADAVYDQVIKPAGWGHTALYERGGVDPSYLPGDLPLDVDTVVSEWEKGYGIINMFGHGSHHGIYRLVWNEDNGDKVPGWNELSEPPYLDYSDAARLSDARPPVVFHMSCSNGTPEYPDNLAYGLLRYAAVGTVSASRVAIVPDISTGPLAIGMARDIVKAVIAGRSNGEALFDAKGEILAFQSQIGWFTMLQYNLYGDPSVTITGCTTDAMCDDGKRCNGQERCVLGQCQAATGPLCTSDDPCTEARCEEPSGRCVQVPRPDGEACDDALFCTVGDRCKAGRCEGAARCAAPQNPCVQGACDEATKSCDVTPLEAEGSACRVGTSREGVCKQGLCEPSSGGCAVGPDVGPDLGTFGWLLLLALAAAWRQRR